MKSVIVIFLTFISLSSFSQSRHPGWENIFLFDSRPYSSSSSELEDKYTEYGVPGKYSSFMCVDNNPATAWVEGVKGYGVGEYVMIGLKDVLPAKIHLNNGYQKTESLYLKNSRPESLKLTLYLAYRLPADVTELGENFRCLQFCDSIMPADILVPVKNILKLKDETGTQSFGLPFDKEKVLEFKRLADSLFDKEFAGEVSARLNPGSDNDWYKEFYGYIIKLEIADVYKGSRWDDTCISDIWFGPEEKENEVVAPSEIITDIFKGDDGNIYFSTSGKEKILLASLKDIEDEDDIVGGEPNIEIMDVSPGKEWAQIDFLFSHEAYIRVEEIPFLYNVRLRKKVDKSLLGDYFSMYGFVEKDGKLFIDTDAGMFDLEELLKAVEVTR